jgi:DNA polymerase I-like protein with 3'-5' exonuclease and polymerase domains
MVFKDIETQKVYSYNPDQINEGLNLLKKATLIIGHSIMGFDLPAIEKVTGYKYKGEILDTLLCSRLIWSNMTEVDYAKKNLPPKLIGKHSIESWGYRLSLRKGDFQEHSTFDVWSKDMQDYCERDVEVTYLLYKLIEKQDYSKQAITLEHDFAHWIIKQEQGGVDFDETSAETLFLSLQKRRLEIAEKLSLVFGSWRKSIGFKTYKRDNRKRGIKAGVPVEQFKTEIFNPNSRDHIADRLKTLGWKPKAFTATGKPEVNEKVLKSLPYDEAKLISEYLLIQKRLGQLSDGEQAYLKLITKEKKIHGKIVTNGAVTGRCTHFNPNLANVSSKAVKYGNEMRSLFIAPTNMVMCGIDFSGLELRVLANYLFNYDSGDFQKSLLEADIHSENQKLLGLSSRDKAKTFIYAYIYSAGNERISEILGVSITEAKRIRETFEKAIPALKNLKNAVALKYRNQKWIYGLDKRKLMCRAEYSSLNTLIQSAGALLVKAGTVIVNNDLQEAGFVWGKDYRMVLHVHDEMQFVVHKDKLEEFKIIAGTLFNKTKEYFNFKCDLAGEIKVGTNWSETH